LETPEPFWGISLHFGDFHQVPDEEVIKILEAQAVKEVKPEEVKPKEVKAAKPKKRKKPKKAKKAKETKTPAPDQPA
jgi:hypothetical protein